jgi:hypothetical protein
LLFNQGVNRNFIESSAPLALDFGTEIPLLNEDF